MTEAVIAQINFVTNQEARPIGDVAMCHFHFESIAVLICLCSLVLLPCWNAGMLEWWYQGGSNQKIKFILIFCLQHVVLHNSHSFEGTSFFSTCNSLQIEQEPGP